MAVEETEYQEDVADTTKLSEAKARRFLNLLAEESFVCLVVTDDELHLFSKGMEPAQIDRIKDNLAQIEGD